MKIFLLVSFLLTACCHANAGHEDLHLDISPDIQTHFTPVDVTSHQLSSNP